MSDFSLQFLTRKRCGLCDTARPIAMRVAMKAGADLVVVDIDGVPDLAARYGQRVPVLLFGDAVIAEGRFPNVRTIVKKISSLS